MTDLWKRKLAAYLHDPPEKAYDHGEHHKQRAEIHAASFGVADLWRSMGGSPDWSAAAADRFVFPHGSKVRESLGDEPRTVFVHPLSGRDESGAPALPAPSLCYPGQSDAEAWLSEIRPEWKGGNSQSLFLRAWRHWSDHAADHAGGKGKGAELLPYLPADTRIPDGSIWHHCAVVSALEATRAGDAPNTALRPAFLLFQVGPVQDFIAQARTTRDLWSGSYLLSWLTMHAIKAVADQCGPDAIIFPSLKGQPIYDFLEQKLLGFEARFDLAQARSKSDRDRVMAEQARALVPGIPNRFLALVPDSFDPVAAERAFQEEWQHIARECRDWLIQESRKNGDSLNFAPPYNAVLDQQVDHHWQITWQLWPWQEADKALAAFKALPPGAENPIHPAESIAHSIPDAHKDERCYRGGQLDPGWAWSAHYQLCQHALDARRSLRDFAAVPAPVDGDGKPRKPGHRDALSGREEAVVQANVLDNLKSHTLRALFRHAEPLGAANLIKRVWHKAYLERLNQVPGRRPLPALGRVRESFDSVPSVAAGAFARRLFDRVGKEGQLREQWLAFVQAASEARDDFPDSIAPFDKSNEPDWLERSDHSIFFPEIWQREQNRKKQAALSDFYHSPEGRARLAKAESALRTLLTEAGAKPSSYYAVLALDGDQIGKWLSGEKSPAVTDVISAKARDYFEQKMLPAMAAAEKQEFAGAMQRLCSEGNTPQRPSGWMGQWPPQSPEDWIRAWLASPRPLNPSWHLLFSEALANFGLFATRRIVEDVHHGQLIYSGGDDALAMLPADEAIACATDLRAAFQGRPADMTNECRGLFREEAPEGFLWLADPTSGEPTWPLLVPGPRLTISLGIAIGHVKEPLQDMIAEAHKAEKRAKAAPEKFVFERSDADPVKHTERWKPAEGWSRDALAVTLFKRSGETIQWGSRFGSAAFDLLTTLRRHLRTPWDQPKQTMPISGRFPYQLAALLGAYEIDKPLSAELREIALREFDHVVSRQAKDLADKTAFRQQAERYLDELVTFSWDRPEKPGLPESPHQAARSLRHFINLFLLEAFIRRQAD